MAEQEHKPIEAEELDQLEALVTGATTPGRWHWSGNTDTGEPYLATWVSGAGRCQVLAIGYEERSTTGQAADKVRADAAEFDLGDPDELVEQWAWDQFGEPARDPRLQLMTDLMSVNARDMAVYEVAPEAMSREDHRVYRADVVDIRHPDAQLMVAAVNALPRLLVEVRAARCRKVSDDEVDDIIADRWPHVVNGKLEGALAGMRNFTEEQAAASVAKGLEEKRRMVRGILDSLAKVRRA